MMVAIAASTEAWSLIHLDCEQANAVRMRVPLEVLDGLAVAVGGRARPGIHRVSGVGEYAHGRRAEAARCSTDDDCLGHVALLAALADFIWMVIAGMSALARDGATRAELEAVAAAAIEAWPIAGVA